MKLNVDDLRRHYASLSDQALRAIDRTELVEIAQQCYDHELAQREPAKKPEIASQPAFRVQEPDAQYELKPGQAWKDAEIVDSEEPPAWIADADCVCTFSARSGNPASEAENVREVLTAAGIPCFVTVRTLDPDPSPGALTEYRVEVPGGMNLEATSVLDKEIYNVEIEAVWRTHLEVLTDDQFFGLKRETILGGLLDRIERIERAYDEEAARRMKSANH
jgi:hypothetical protein